MNAIHAVYFNVCFRQRNLLKLIHVLNVHVLLHSLALLCLCVGVWQKYRRDVTGGDTSDVIVCVVRLGIVLSYFWLCDRYFACVNSCMDA